MADSCKVGFSASSVEVAHIRVGTVCVHKKEDLGPCDMLSFDMPSMPRTLLLLTLLAIAATTKAQWQLQDAHTTADLRGIDNVGHGIAWASGTDGTIHRPHEAGGVWQLCAKPPNGEHLDFRAIQAFDNSTAIIMSSGKGDLSRLYKTTDGCQTWKLVFTNPDPDGFFDALSINAPNQDALGQSGWTTLTLFMGSGNLGDPVDGSLRVILDRRWRRDMVTQNRNDERLQRRGL